MIHFSTLPSGLFPAEDIQFETLDTLSEEDTCFLNSLRKRLDEEMKDPDPQTIKNIMRYSANFGSESC